MRNPDNPAEQSPVIVAGKDESDVDNDFFLCPVNILDHQGSLKCSFPVENRLLSQGRDDLKKSLASDRNYNRKLADFHLLLYLAGKLDRGDLLSICKCVQTDQPILEGFQVLIDSLASV